MATLRVVSGNNAGQSYELSADQVTLGRYAFCDVVFHDHSISREHAQIIRDGESYLIEDLGSLNGTHVNDEPIHGRVRLRSGDRVRLYNTEMVFSEGEAPVATALGPADSGRQSAFNSARAQEASPAATCTVRFDEVADIEAPESSAQVKLKAVLEFTRRVGSTLAVDEILPRIVEAAFEIFPQAIRGYILRGSDDQGRLMPFVIRHRHEKADAPPTFGPLDQRLAQQVISQQEAVLVAGDPGDPSQVLSQGDVSSMCAPLMGPARRPLGVIHLESKPGGEPFEREDLDMLASVATMAGQALEYAMLHEARLRHERRNRELSMAKQVQRHFLPRKRPSAAGYDFFHHYQPAQEVGGDYFGYIPLPDDRLALAIGDVAGKGVSAALLMARLCSEVRYNLVSADTPAEAVGRLAREIAGPSGDLCFVTFLLCVLAPRTHELTVVNAGHMPPLVRRSSGDVEAIGADQAGFPLGFDLQHDYQAAETSLAPGDLVLMYTDGVSEALNMQGEIFSNRRVRELMARTSGGVKRMGLEIVAELERFVSTRPPNDDACLICFRRLPLAD